MTKKQNKTTLRINVFDDCGVLEETHVDMAESSQTPHMKALPTQELNPVPLSFWVDSVTCLQANQADVCLG